MIIFVSGFPYTSVGDSSIDPLASTIPNITNGPRGFASSYPNVSRSVYTQLAGVVNPKGVNLTCGGVSSSGIVRFIEVDSG